MDGTDGEETRPAIPRDLILFGEIVKRLGVHPSRAYVITTSPGFPRPWYRGEKERIWLRADIDPWLEARAERLRNRRKT